MGSSVSAPREWVQAVVECNIVRMKGLLAVRPELINCQDRERLQTALHIACRGGYVDVVKFLLRNEASLTSRDEQSMTPLDHAKQRGHDHIVKLFSQWDSWERDKLMRDRQPALNWLRAQQLEHLVRFHLVCSSFYSLDTPDKLR